MNARNVLLWLHIVVAMVTMGPLIMFDVAAPIAIKSGNAGAARFVAGLGKKLGPGTMLIALLGLALVGEGGYELKDRWVIAALVIYVLMVAIGIAILGKNVDAAADKLEAGEDVSAELAKLKTFGPVNIVLFLAILWLMVAKPGL
ncbi:MAG TPA: DUF2269 family protein [Mycobacteriales bacterium]|nr:DUF2269 family protein [Mycobacteriales bacterium]